MVRNVTMPIRYKPYNTCLFGTAQGLLTLFDDKVSVCRLRAPLYREVIINFESGDRLLHPKYDPA
jgi:hypothetical protein